MAAGALKSAMACLLCLSNPAVAASTHCDADLATINIIAAMANLKSTEMKDVNEAIVKGEKLHAAGNEEGCEKALAPARKILGIREKHVH